MEGQVWTASSQARRPGDQVRQGKQETQRTRVSLVPPNVPSSECLTYRLWPSFHSNQLLLGSILCPGAEVAESENVVMVNRDRARVCVRLTQAFVEPGKYLRQRCCAARATGALGT